MSPLHVGDEFADVDSAEPAFVVTDVGLPGQRVRILHLDSEQEEVLKVDVLRERVSAGMLTCRRRRAPRVSPAMQHDLSLQEDTAAALRQLSEVRDYSTRYDVSIHKAFHRVHEAYTSRTGEQTGEGFCSRATLYRRLAAARAGQPLLHGDANKGNRTPRYGEAVVELLLDTARTLHQTPGSRWNFTALTDHCNMQLHDAGLLPVDRKVSCKFVRNVVFTRLTTDAEIARLPPQMRAARKAVAKHAIRVDGFLQRVEQDALHLPWRVKTSAGEVRDVYLVHAIDVATGLPVGWSLSIGAPSTAATFACVESILFSKKDRLAALNVPLDADFYGTPTCIVFDNGPEARNDRIGGLVRLGVEVQYCKSRHPHHKPFIERLNRALKEALQTLPGCTRMDGKDGMRDPNALGDLPMSLDELERWIVRWYFEDWALRPLERLIRSSFADATDLGATPLARYQRMERDGYSMPLPPNRNEWRHLKCEKVQRTLARTTGVTFENFHFRGANLERLIARFGESPVDVLIDPDDFRFVHVVDGDVLVVLFNSDVNESTPVLSFSEAKARETAARDAALAAGKSITEKFRRDVFAASIRTNKGAGRRTGVSTAKQSLQDAKHAAAVQKTRQSPLPAQAVGIAHSPIDTLSLDGLDALPVVDRRTGEAL